MRGGAAGAALLLLALAAGCRKSGERRLEGHWHGDTVEGASAAEEPAAAAFALGTELDFHGGSVLVKTPRDRVTSPFKVVREDKTTVVVVTDADGPSAPQTFVFSDENTMQWTIVPGKRISFRREK